jgi:hypothetical protein
MLRKMHYDLDKVLEILQSGPSDSISTFAESNSRKESTESNSGKQSSPGIHFQSQPDFISTTRESNSGSHSISTPLLQTAEAVGSQLFAGLAGIGKAMFDESRHSTGSDPKLKSQQLYTRHQTATLSGGMPSTTRAKSMNYIDHIPSSHPKPEESKH